MAANVRPLKPSRGLALAATVVLMAPLVWGMWLPTAASAALAHLNIGAPPPPFSAKGADGQGHRLSDYAGKIVVLEWTSPVCPFTAIKYDGGAMQALQRYAAARHVVWLSIDTAAADRAGYLTPAAAKARIAKTHAVVSEFLFDPTGDIGRAYGAKATPSFFIVDAAGKLAYQGAMSDDHTKGRGDDSGPAKAAITDLAEGRKVRNPETQPYGCAIEY